MQQRVIQRFLARKRAFLRGQRLVLEGFEQAFLTGTAAEVTPIKSIGPWNFEVGEMTLQLQRDYDDLVMGRIPNA